MQKVREKWMKVATILFTYNRSWHTEQVLKALSKNYVLPEILFIFQDGIKGKEHEKEWKKVNLLINNVNFCPIKVIVSKENKGLSKSILCGINYVFQDYDTIIVLEDDCVPTRNFIGFMNQALDKYWDSKIVYNVTGFGYSDKFERNKYDAYFVGRTSSWGWGTWKDRWDKFYPNPEDLNEIIFDEKKSKQLATWGNDLPAMMKSQLNGLNDSWAVYWALYVIKNQGLCLAPYCSLIKNIGMDGTGVHCGTTNLYDVVTECANEKIYSFPDELVLDFKTAFYFMERFGGYTAQNGDIGQKPVIVYGLGYYFRQNEKYLCNQYYIKGFVDRAKNGYYAGKKIIDLDDIHLYSDCQILILIIDMNESEKVSKSLSEDYGIKKEKISRIIIEN